LIAPLLLVGSGRCGSTLLQSVLNTNPEFLIWGEHNRCLRQIAAAYYDAAHPRFPDQSGVDATDRIKKLRDARRWPAWDNLCGAEEFPGGFERSSGPFSRTPRAARRAGASKKSGTGRRTTIALCV